MAEHHHALSGTALKQAFLLTTLILAIEVAAGFASHSLALLSDAGHILTDVVALGLAWFAVEQSKRAADARRTYGYHRVGILAAMVNGATLIVIVMFIAIEAARRFANPQPVQGGLVIVAALLAIGVNGFIAMRLRGGGNLNIRAAMLHVIGDIGASIGVIESGVIILLTGWYYADPLVSLCIAALIAWGALRIVESSSSPAHCHRRVRLSRRSILRSPWLSRGCAPCSSTAICGVRAWNAPCLGSALPIPEWGTI